MTDGILLAETQGDRFLDHVRHDHHRRGPRALAEHRLPARLSEAAAAAAARPEADHHLGHDRSRALLAALRRVRPIINVSGRTYPVEVRYRPRSSATRKTTRPIQRRAGRDPGRGRRAVARPGRATSSSSSPASARSARPPNRCASTIRTAARSCRCTRGCRRRSSSGCSSRQASRRIVLATNVAETSLTVPGIRCVIDTGVARISRYSASQPSCSACRSRRSRRPAPTSARAAAAASAPGIAIRLYSRGGLPGPPGLHRAGDPAHQPGGVILQMKSLKLGDIEAFPFVEPPDARTSAMARARCASWAR